VGVELQRTDSLSPSYIDLEVDIGRVTLPLAGPCDDAAYPSYLLIIRTNQAINTEDSLVSIEIKGDKNQSKTIPLIKSDNEHPFATKSLSKFFLYGICPLGEVN
jgi:hypothetical protein